MHHHRIPHISFPPPPAGLETGDICANACSCRFRQSPPPLIGSGVGGRKPSLNFSTGPDISYGCVTSSSMPLTTRTAGGEVLRYCGNVDKSCVGIVVGSAPVPGDGYMDDAKPGDGVVAAVKQGERLGVRRGGVAGSAGLKRPTVDVGSGVGSGRGRLRGLRLWTWGLARVRRMRLGCGSGLGLQDVRLEILGHRHCSLRRTSTRFASLTGGCTASWRVM